MRLSVALFALPAFLAILLGAPRPLLAAEPAPSAPPTPSAERIRSAAEEYDMGRRAFIANAFEQAAVHFENAYSDAPRAEALRNAIRARRAAKQGARAATLASLAAIHYGNDATTMALVNETLADLSPQLYGVSLACEPACGVAADGRVVSLSDAKEIGFYLEPGRHELLVSWSGDRTKRVSVDAVAGGAQELRFAAPPWRDSPAPSSSPAAPSRDRAAPASGASGASRKPFGPAVFIAGAAITALGAAATIVSGIDAQNNPGKEAVLRDCVGQGESCATYQSGKSAELRTNVILGGTVGAAVITTVIGVFFTQWRRSPSAAARVEPYVDMRGGGLIGRF